MQRRKHQYTFISPRGNAIHLFAPSAQTSLCGRVDRGSTAPIGVVPNIAPCSMCAKIVRSMAAELTAVENANAHV